MESPVVLDKPPEYGNGNNERGFPFDEEDGSGAWRQLAARHPDIAARLRARPQNWQRKRRPSGQDADDLGDEFSGFDRFPFDDIPAEFREHFPQHFSRREHPAATQPPPPQPAPQQQTSSTQTTATQTDQPTTSILHPQENLPQHGLRNTVDLGQKSPADPSVADDRQRSMSAPPETGPPNMSHQPPPQPEQPHQPHQPEAHSNVRHIPIFVEGRDEPVINKSPEHGAHFAEAKPAFVPPPPPHDRDREQYFTDDIPVGFNHPQNFSRAFGTPFHKGFRQGPQPFVQQKVYPQTAFARSNSPHRSQSPKPQQEEFVKVPVHHESRPEPPKPAQQQPPPKPAQQQPPPPPPKPAPSPNDPITQILAVQTDVLNLMTEVENFTGAKKDKRYMFLDEMLTRNLIKLDTIETDGKENIRQARREAIKCIQKCIAVLEAKAEKGTQAADVEMKDNAEAPKLENGEQAKEEKQELEAPQPRAESEPVPTPQAADTRPEQPSTESPEGPTPEAPKPEEPKGPPADGEKKKKVGGKKKRDKSKESKSSDKESNNAEVMQVDDKGDKPAPNSQTMEVDGAAASQ